MERKERKKGRDKEKKRRERGRKGNLHSDSRNSLEQEVKSKDYTPRGRNSSYYDLFFTIKAMRLCPCPKGLFGRILKYENAALF